MEGALAVLAAAGFALGAASLIVVALARLSRPAPPASAPSATGSPTGAVFLFEGPDLVDATPAGRRLLDGAGGAGGRADLAGLLRLLGRRFGPDLGARLAALPAAGRIEVPAEPGPGLLEAEAGDGALRLTLRLGADGPDGGGEEAALDRLRLEAAERDLDTLAALAEDAPFLAWHLGPSGEVLWASRAYEEAARPAAGEGGAADGAGPARPFADAPTDGPEGVPVRRRLPLRRPGRPEQWFEVTSVRRGAGSVHFATDAGGLMTAEGARQVVVHTLTKTFATLATGLAIFDRARRLVLFNPAFVELTGLPAPFLAAGPPLASVLDRLRDAKVVPEPRTHASWRDQVAALETAAARGGYCEAWTLPGGQVYRVTGRPHPDGALAFLLEDISDEVALTRRFRSELDTAQAVLDSLDEAVAVFTAQGTLSLANAAYARLWGACGGLGDATLGAEAARWEAASGPSGLWARLRDDPRRAGEGGVPPLRLRDGRAVAARVAPLAGGAVLVGFRLPPP